MTDLVICLPLVLPLLAPAAASWLLAGSAPALAAASSAVLGLLAQAAMQ